VIVGVLVGVAVGTTVAFGLGDGANVGVVVAVDVIGEGLVVFVVRPAHPATNTVANTLITINMIKNCFFIAIPSLGNFSVVRGSL
jgi:hypothetical protein